MKADTKPEQYTTTTVTREAETVPSLRDRVTLAVLPLIKELDTAKKEYVITVEIVELT